MRKIYILALITFTTANSQCLNTVTHLSGTESINNIFVTVTPSGVAGTIDHCGLGPYSLGNDLTTQGDGGYRFEFSPSIGSLSIDLYGMNNDDIFNNEEVEIFINNQHYTPQNVGDIGYQCGIYIPTLPVINSSGYLCDIIDPLGNTSGCKDLIISGNITSIEVVNHITGNTGGLLLKLKICETFLGNNESENEINGIFPNPFSDQTNLYLPKKIINGNINIFNSLGQMVREIKNVSTNHVIIERNDLPNGIYYIKVLEENIMVYNGKIIAR